jgi:hypothetical protein
MRRLATVGKGQRHNRWSRSAGHRFGRESSRPLGPAGHQFDFHLFLGRFNGTAWDTTFGTLADVAAGVGTIFSGDLAVDALGAATVAWIEEDTCTGIYSVYTWKSDR